MFLEIKGIKKSFGAGESRVDVLKGIDLEIEKGELVVFVGPSGCGKSTTLRMIAGLEDISDGELWIGDKLVNYLEPKERDLAMVFQSYALYPQMNIYDNIAFSLQVRKVPKKEIDKRVHHVAELLGLENLLKQRPKNISGGQRQRVAIGNAIIREPKVLLMDEPLSNLDAKLRLSMRVEIKRLQKKLGITTLFVTHDQEECFSISDKVAVMNGGVIEQYDTPENIYRRPATEFVARFIGFENFLDVEKKADHVYTLADGTAFKTAMDLEGKEYAATIRPDDIRLADETAFENVLGGKIGVRTFLGKSYQYEVETAAGILKVNMGTDHVFKEGDVLRLYLPEDKLILVRR